jgi:ABC-type phosphate transport system substrate-binding protein
MRPKFYIVILIASFLTGSVIAQDKAGDLAIIVAKNSAIDSLTSEELHRIFFEEKTKDPDGHRFVIIMRETGSPENAAAMASIYKFDAGEYDTYFLRAVFAGRATGKPQQLNGSAAVRQFIASTPGAIGYARASEVDDTLKVVKVDGKLPGDAGYPLAIK